MKCSACGFDSENNQFIDLNISGSIKLKEENNRIKSIYLYGCPKCGNVIWDK